MTDRDGMVVLRTAMYIAYAHQIVRYAADMMGRVDPGSADPIRTAAEDLHGLMESVRAMRAESEPEQSAAVSAPELSEPMRRLTLVAPPELGASPPLHITDRLPVTPGRGPSPADT